MPRRESRRPLLSGEVRAKRDLVRDHPYDKTTWSDEQLWTSWSYPELKRKVKHVEKVSTLKKMASVFRRIHSTNYERVVKAEIQRRDERRR